MMSKWMLLPGGKTYIDANRVEMIEPHPVDPGYKSMLYLQGSDIPVVVDKGARALMMMVQQAQKGRDE